MSTDNLVIIAVLLVLLAEVTYLVAKLPRQTNSKKRLILVDTSVLIDGRIISVAKSGFIGDTLAMPRSVIGELQYLADNADAEKRARARHGLDIVKELQDIEYVDVMILRDSSKAEEGVDERLLNLARKHTGSVICTIDYNLNKVAVVEGFRVLNVNELAQTLRMSYLPGEKMVLELVQKGQDNHQGVGYLKDGTMVVVEQASKYVGKSVEIEFIRSLQTAAGKMMFAKLTEQPKSSQQVTKDATPRDQNNRVKQPQGRAPQPKQEKAKVTATKADTKKSQPVATDAVKPVKAERPAKKRAQRSPRRATQTEREAALIDLVERQ